MEDIIKKIKDHPKFTFADSDDELISIIDDVNPGLSRDQKFEIIDDLEKLGRSGSRKGQDFTIDGIKNTAKAFKSATSGETKQNIKNAVKQNDQRVEQNRRDSLTQDQRDAEDNLKAAQERIRKEKNDAEVDRLYDQMKGSRKGTGPLCNLVSVSGKGSRPENLGSIASKVSLGRNRYINMDGEYIEQ